MGFLDYTGLARFKQKLDVLFAGKLDTSLKGAANGLAELDSTGKVVSSQLPDIGNVIEVASYSNLPATGAEHTIYITTDTNESYRWDTNHYDKIANPNDMVGASGSSAGASGLVPAPSAGDHEKFLKGDGTWAEAGETVYANTIDMSSSDSTKISEAIAEKVDKVTGKGLSTNDYTTADQTAVQTTLPNKITAIETAKGANGGYAELDSSGKVPASQLPSYVDDVEEYPTLNDFPATGESGKIYVATSTNITYRWGGSEYVPIGSDLALGETSSTAYRGDRGKAAYDHATAKGSAYVNGFYKITTNSEGHVTSASAVQKSDITDLGIPGSHQDISGKADKVSNATSGNFAGLDSNGNLTDSGSKASDFLTQHQDITGKADKVSNATSGNFAGLDANGNLTDSGSKASDFLTQHQDISGKVDKNQGVAYAGKALGINAQGVVEPVAFSVDDFTGATASTDGTHGLVPAPEAGDEEKFLRGDGTWAVTSEPVYGNTIDMSSTDNTKVSEAIDDKLEKTYEVDSSVGKSSKNIWLGEIDTDGGYIWVIGDNIYYSYDEDNQRVLDKTTFRWTDMTWNGLMNFSRKAIWSDGENIYCSKGIGDQYVLDVTTSTWIEITWNDNRIFGGHVWSDGEYFYYSQSTLHLVLDKTTSTWSNKTWYGLTNFYGNDVWSDGENIYYSNGSTQYVLDKSTSTWTEKTWNALTNFYGKRIWTDGEYYYYSSQYVLDKTTSTWVQKSWGGLSFNGECVWTYDGNIYYSYNKSTYILDRSTSTWSKIALIGPIKLNGDKIWTDGNNYYSSSGSNQYIFDKTTSVWITKHWYQSNLYGNKVWYDGDTVYYSSADKHYVFRSDSWSSKRWNGLTNFDAAYIWTYGGNVYYSYDVDQYVLNRSTSTWEAKTWNNVSTLLGSHIWTDGEKAYYSYDSTQYVLDESTSTWNTKTWNGHNNISGEYIWHRGDSIYYSSGTNQYVLDRSTDTWVDMHWGELTNFSGDNIWMDDKNIYLSENSNQYLLKIGQPQVLIGEEGQWTKVSVDEFSKYISSGTLRLVPFSIGVNSWALENGVYSYTYPTEYVTTTSVEFIEYDSSYRAAVRGDMNTSKASGGVTFTTDVLPVDTLTGEIRIFDRNDGKVAIVTQTAALPTIREVPFTLAVSDWSLNTDNMYEAVFNTAYVTQTSHDFVEFDESIENATDGIKAVKATTGMKFLSRRIPAGPISGTITPLDNADGKVAVALQDTVMPIANGGTGANTLAGAKENLGITALQEDVEELSNNIVQLWENPNPTSSFSAQTISVDLSAYRFAFVVSSDGTGTALVGYDRACLVLGNTPGNLRGRTFKGKTNGVEFGAGLNNSGATDNTNCIPYRIYGIK